MVPDSPEGVAVRPRLPEIPFQYIVPANAGLQEYSEINVRTCGRPQSGETLWDLDFVSPAPPQPSSV